MCYINCKHACYKYQYFTNTVDLYVNSLQIIHSPVILSSDRLLCTVPNSFSQQNESNHFVGSIYKMN